MLEMSNAVERPDGTTSKAGFDTVSFIDSVNQDRREHRALQAILKARQAGRVVIAVSQHTLHQLEKKPDAALALAQTAEVVPHYPIGTWDGQVRTWNSLAGTWDDIKRNDSLRDELHSLAKAGADIRDLGALIDCIHARVGVFVTSDTDLVASGPAKQIADRFGIRIVTPSQFASELPPDAG
ncbi:MAG: hypothetical protein DMF89_17640 [Acidobacteria bacterium]|nr:MAG: hypothetical protein DMF89_17640 [Acidobacteriota bacterium]